MDATFSVDDLRDAARMARDCPVMGHAVALARWSEDDPAEPEPFDLANVNRKLAELAEQGSPS